MKMYIRLIAFLIFSFISFISFTQDNSVAVNLPSSPEAESLVEYGNVPVGEYTGVPNVNVPLPGFQYRSISVPVSLSYHSQGIKVSEEASWAGLGWSLQAGGVITRTIRGEDDFTNTLACDNLITIEGYLSTNSIPEDPDDFAYTALPWESSDNLGSVRSTFAYDPGLLFLHKRVDKESDLYSFNFGGYSGKFVFNKDKEPVLLSKSDLRIELNPRPGEPSHWDIITPEGLRYTFGGTPNSIQTTSTDNHTTRFQTIEEDFDVVGHTDIFDHYPLCPVHISSWFLQRITHPSGYEVTFEYELEDEAFLVPIPRYSESVENFLGETQFLRYNDDFASYSEPHIYRELKTYSVTRYSNIYLSRIVSDHNIIEFTRKPRTDVQGGFSIDEIKYYTRQLNEQGTEEIKHAKSVVFDHSYFQSNGDDTNDWFGNLADDFVQYIQNNLLVNITENQLNQRLKLVGIDIVEGEQGVRSDDPLRYNFSYNENNTLPKKSSMGIDHWGFANGADNELLVPGFFETAALIAIGEDDVDPYGIFTPTGERDLFPVLLESDTDREPNPAYLDTWLMREIQYPTGGKTVFDYESNTYLGGTTTGNLSFFKNYSFAVEQCNVPIPPPSDIGLIGEGEDPASLVQVDLNYSWVLAPCPPTTNVCDDYSCTLPEPDGVNHPGFSIIIRNTATDDVVSQIQHTSGTFSDIVFNGYEEWTFQGSVEVLPGAYEISVVPYSSLSALPGNLEAVSLELNYPGAVPDPEEKPGAGARISKIENFDIDNQVTHTRLFEYELEGEATGKLYAPPTYVHFIRGLGTTGPGVNTMVDFYYRDYAIRSSNSYISLNNGYTGAYVGYSAVKTTIGYDAEGGYTIKKFHNNGTYRDPKKYVRENIPFFVNQLDGMLHQQEDYNQQADLVRTIENMYTNEPSATDFNWNYIWGNFEYITNSPDFGYHAVPLTIAYADAPQWVKLDKTTEIYYGQTSGDVTTINEYTYEPDHFNMIEHTITNGTDITQTTTFEYAKELATDDPSYELMASDAIHMTGIPLRIKPPNGTEYQTFYNTTYFEPEAFTEKYRDDSQITRSEVLAFDAIGYPERVQNYGFAHPEILEWELGLLKSRTYLDFVDAYDYEMRQVASITAVDKQVVYYDYDRHRRLAGIRARDNKVNTTITYSIGGPNEVEQIITFDDDDLLVQPKSSLKKYDGLGRLTHEYNNGRLENHILYDQIGRIGSETFLTGNYVGYAYDNSPLNQLTLQILPDGNTIATQYEAEDNLYKQLVTDEEDRVTSLFYDILQRQVQVIDAIGGSTEWQFNGYNNLESITTPMGALHEYDYDDRNRMISKAIPGGGTTTYGYYNNSDLLHFQTDGNGIRQSYEYDDYQRLRFNYRGFINDGDVLVEHKYYNEGESDHIDKIEYSRYRVLDGGDEYTTDAYAYDEYGRPYLSTFQHLLGQNLVINNFDLADRLRQASTLHQGHESHSTIQNYEYDSFDRTTRINHEFDDLFSAQVAAYSYNDRDQMIGKVFGNEQGEGLYGLGYQYDNDRGWLRQINKSFNDAAPIPTCLDYEPPQIDDEPDSDDFYYQQMTLTEYLDQRLDVSFQFNPEDDHCPTLECPVPTCTAAEIQQELQTLEATIRRETSYEQAVPCEDGSTEIITIIDFPEHNFPTVLYRVRLCDNSERYILEAYLDLLPTSYEIVQEIPIAGPNQRITTTVGGETLTPTVTEILALIIAGEDIILADYVPCGQPDCNYELECPYEELLAQMAILDLIQQNTPEVVPSPEDYSITVYEVQLCNGEIIYLLEEELELLEGTNILVLGTIEFELAEDRIPVISDVPGGGYRNYPSGVFHMRFSYTPSGNIEWYNLAVYNRARTRQSFSYDDLNRLTSSTYADFTEDGNSLTTDNKYGVPSISYDGDGNITNLVRRGLSYWCEDEVPYYDVIDALSYTYDGLPNQLTSLTEAADKTKGFKTGSNTAGYGYDGVGNMTYDGHRGLAINYNVLNLPQEIATGPDGDYTIIYDASGHKLRQVFENSDNIDITLDYVSGLEYRNGNLEAVNHEEGRIYFPRSLTDEPAASAFREYFIQDHLGNTRLVIGDRNGNNALDLGQDPETDEIIQENNYYPFGMAMEGQWIEHGGEQVRYQYNSKELIEDIGLLDYGARWYDPGIGRWNAVDPMAEKMVEWSPYNYTFGNPIAFNDPSGMIPYRVGNGKPAHLDFTPDEEWLSNGIIANGGNNGGGDKPEKVDYDPGTGEYVVTASRLDIGDTRKVKAPDPGRINYSTGIWGDSKTEAYIGAGEWMTIKPFRSTQSAEIASIIMPTGGGAIKGSKFLKWIFSRRKIFRRTGPILNPVNTGKRAGSAAYKSLNAGDSQHFFSNIVDNYASYAAKFPLRSGDGVARNLYQIRGSLRGKDGIFEWIVEGSKVTHRRFIPKGSINGIPNQIVR